MRKRDGGFLAALACLVLFIYIFMHEDDPYFVFDNLVLNISTFSQLTSSMAKTFRWMVNSTNQIQLLIVKVNDFIVSGPLTDVLDWLLETNPVSWFSENGNMISPDGWFFDFIEGVIR